MHKRKEDYLDLEDLELQLLELRKPSVWNVWEEGNKEIEMEVEFEKFLLAISEFSNEKIDEMSTFRFYALINYLKEKHKSNGK